MKVTFWGVRGSIPVPGSETLKYGGNSSCVEVRAPGATPLVLDCGSGARKLGLQLITQPERRLDLLFTHFHIDHVLGFPFFVPIFAPSFTINVYAPLVDREDVKTRLDYFLNGVFHPLYTAGIPARVSYNTVVPRIPFVCEPYTITPVELNHPGNACGYRIEHGGKVVVYLTDTRPLTPNHLTGVEAGQPPTPWERKVIEGMRDADLAIFDTMFTFDEYLTKPSWGHSYPAYAVALAKAAGVRQLYLFHHAPEATDELLDRVAATWANHRDPVVRLAQEGSTVDLEG